MRAKVELQTDKINAEGLAPLSLRVSHGPQRKRLALGLAIKPDRWDGDQVRGRSKEASQINSLIQKAISAARDAEVSMLTRGEEVTAERVRDHVQSVLVPDSTPRSTSLDFLAYARGEADRFEAADQIGSANRVRVVCNKLSAFAGSKVEFGDLRGKAGVRFLRAFADYLQKPEEKGGKGNSHNTVVSNFSMMRNLLNRAARDGYFEESDTPFKHIKLGERPPKRERLTPAQLAAFAQLDLPDPKSFPEDGAVARVVRDAFLVSLYQGGARFADIATLKWSAVADGKFRYRMGKTAKEKAMPLAAPSSQILDAYDWRRGQWQQGGSPFVFPMLDAYELGNPPGSDYKATRRAISSRNAQTNVVLKKLAVKAEISRSIEEATLHFHAARHTFSQLALDRGWDVYDISRALGHTKLNVTERYLSGLARDDFGDKLDDLFA